MADGRMLKKKISTDVNVADLENPWHILLFTWGISHLDVEGRITGHAREFKAIVAPLLDKITVSTVKDFFSNAANLGLIRHYYAEGRWAIEYPGFKKNQSLRPDKEGQSLYPPPPIPDNSGTTPGVIPDCAGSTPAEVKRREVKRRETSVCVLDENFEAFWKAYPKKIAKRDALAAWKKSNGRPPIEKILAALERQKQSEDWNKDNGQFIPHPTTWINKGRWDDEVFSPQTINQPPQRRPCPCGSGMWEDKCTVCKGGSHDHPARTA